MFKLKLVALGISAIVAGYGVGILALGVVEAQQPPPHASSTADSSGGGQWTGSHASPAEEQQGGETVTIINASYHHNTLQGSNATQAKVWGEVSYDRTAMATAKDITRVSGKIHNPPGNVIKWRVKFSIEHKCKAEVLPDPDTPPGDTQTGYYDSRAWARSQVKFSIHEFEGSADPISESHMINSGEKEWEARKASNSTGAEVIPRAAGTNGPDDPGDNGIFEFYNPNPTNPADPYYELALTDNTQYARLDYWVEAEGQVEAKRPEIKNGVEAEVSVPEGGYMQAWDYSDPEDPVMMKKSDGTTNASWEVK